MYVPVAALRAPCPPPARYASSMPHPYLPGLGFVRTQFDGELVEHAIDELVAVGAAIFLGQFDGFIEDDAIRRFRMMLELVGAQQQHAALDRRHFLPGAVDELLHRRLQG